jgi:hypothetical protein
MLSPLVARFRGARLAVHAEAADRWGVRSGVLVDALLLMPFAGAAVVIVSWAERPVFHALTDDDAILEWLQFAGYAAAAVLGAWIAFALRRAGNRPMAALFVAFALGCVFIAGEEISWGQRIFGWGTPEPLERINHQAETTIHNIGTFSELTNVVMLIMGAVGFLAPWLVRRHPGRLPADLERYAVPPLFLGSAFLIVFAYKGLRFTLFPDPRSATVSFGEWPESCLAYALMTFALLTRRRLQVADEAGDLGGSAPRLADQPLQRGVVPALQAEPQQRDIAPAPELARR